MTSNAGPAGVRKAAIAIGQFGGISVARDEAFRATGMRSAASTSTRSPSVRCCRTQGYPVSAIQSPARAG
ncbi:hypothetical protein MFUM_970030 [Methylacidiphilum fumariolicum SolV]|uniref:Uncharacterized protein n=2 Tax=Candidatus Methylacidiphilum fumarolicum TaxID=591154 RepID=I0K191_METFB|nr:conserved protein of unknown function [Candidatus Methylacidiphilum fumarolicum]CCG93260.1 hypothetical protein MFUM_970030 [Methylacidiphilum fumariolicum SolV]